MTSPLYTSSHWGSYRFEKGQLVPVHTDPFPSDIGKSWLAGAQDKAVRIARPAIRKGWLEGKDRQRSGDAEFVEVSWDEAIDITAQAFQTTISEYGNQAIFGGSYGWASAGRFHHAQSQLQRFLNVIGGASFKKNTYSHAGAEVLFPHIFGDNFMEVMAQATSWNHITSHCELIVAFGGMTARTSQVASGGVARHHVSGHIEKLKQKGVRMVNISPLKTDLEAGEWLSIVPGSDRAMMLALAYVLFDRKLADLEFLDRYTSGAKTWQAMVMGELDGQPKTPQWAAEICGIPADTIISLACDMARHRTLINIAYGLQRAERGEETLWACINLAATVGQIGKPGTGFTFGAGSMNSSSRPVKTRKWPSLPTGKNPVKSFIPVARITEMLESPNQQFRYDGQHYSYPDIQLIIWSGGNPFHHHQDLFRLEKAWQKPQTVIVTDHSWTATARRADIVLPSSSALERTDIMMQYRECDIVYMSPVLPRFEDSKDDYQIFSAIAEKMGAGEAFTQNRSEAEWLASLWQEARQLHPELPDFQSFQEQGIYHVEDSEHNQDFLGRFIDDPVAHPLTTPSGKIELASEVIASMKLDDLGATPSWTTPTEWSHKKEGMLYLISPQPQLRLHAQNDSAGLSKAAKIKGREPCYMHPDTAARYGLSDGDIALLENHRGRTLAGLILTPDIQPDTVALPTGAWMESIAHEDGPLEIHGNPNVLTPDKGTTELSQGNPAHTALVRASRWTGPLPDITVFNGPHLVTLG